MLSLSPTEKTVLECQSEFDLSASLECEVVLINSGLCVFCEGSSRAVPNHKAGPSPQF